MDGEPPFAAPWQARAFALTVALHKAGLFAWREWAEILSQQIAAADHQHDGHTPSYYECWLAALERILVEKNLASPEILRKTADETLRDWPRPDHTPRREPVTVARAHAGDK
jgi:nitrile hydratase accessory protein